MSYPYPVEKNMGGGWFWWATYPTIEQAIEAVKGYCLGPGTSFRVLNEAHQEVFRWESPAAVEAIEPNENLRAAARRREVEVPRSAGLLRCAAEILKAVADLRLEVGDEIIITKLHNRALLIETGK